MSGTSMSRETCSKEWCTGRRSRRMENGYWQWRWIANGGNDAACCPLMVLRKVSLLGRRVHARLLNGLQTASGCTSRWIRALTALTFGDKLFQMVYLSNSRLPVQAKKRVWQ